MTALWVTLPVVFSAGFAIGLVWRQACLAGLERERDRLTRRCAALEASLDENLAERDRLKFANKALSFAVNDLTTALHEAADPMNDDDYAREIAKLMHPAGGRKFAPSDLQVWKLN